MFSKQHINDIIKDKCDKSKIEDNSPGNEFDEGRWELNSGLGVEDGGVRVSDEVGGDDILIGVAQNTLHRALRGLPEIIETKD